MTDFSDISNLHRFSHEYGLFGVCIDLYIDTPENCVNYLDIKLVRVYLVYHNL